jgi:uncharacterized membrane protein
MTKFCTQCGATVNDAARFCNKCGTPLATTQPTPPASPPGTAPTMKYSAPDYDQAQQPPHQPYQQPYQAPVGVSVSADLKPNLAGMLCYPLSFITGLIFLVLAPYNRDRFVRFHAYQSIFFFVAMLALNIALGILGIVLPWRLERMLDRMLSLLGLAGTVWLMYQAYQGQMFKLPVIGDWAERQANKP